MRQRQEAWGQGDSQLWNPLTVKGSLHSSSMSSLWVSKVQMTDGGNRPISLQTKYYSSMHNMRVCVCVREREIGGGEQRKREREKERREREKENRKKEGRKERESKEKEKKTKKEKRKMK